MSERGTPTARGVGPVHGLPRDGCPACHIARDAETVEPAVAFAFGLALILVRGEVAIRSMLCPAHASLVELLAAELRTADSR